MRCISSNLYYVEQGYLVTSCFRNRTYRGRMQATKDRSAKTFPQDTIFNRCGVKIITLSMFAARSYNPSKVTPKEIDRITQENPVLTTSLCLGDIGPVYQ